MFVSLSLLAAIALLGVYTLFILKKEKSIRESQAYYKSLFENQVMAVAVEEEDMTLSLVNKKFEELSGYSREEVEGKMKSTDFSPLKEREKIIIHHKKRLEGKIPVPPSLYQTKFVTKNGEIKYVQVYAAVIPGTKKTIAVLNDITESRKVRQELQRAYRLNLKALTTALEAREHGIERHCERVAYYTKVLARRMGLDDGYTKDIVRGALLHDIGKIGVRDSILLKPGKLTPEEEEEVKKHPVIGANILKGIDYFARAIEVVLYHHERWDGKGYPFGLSGEKIPLSARIFSVVDAFDAMTTDRPYRKKMSIEDATKEIKRCAGSQFDPEVVRAFLGVPLSQLHF